MRPCRPTTRFGGFSFVHTPAWTLHSVVEKLAVMPDITTPTAALAASVPAYTVAASLGIPDALALPVAVAAAGGASWAMSNRPRVEAWNARAATNAVVAWLFSWLFGVLFGPICAAVAMSWIPTQYGKAVPAGALSSGCALVLSAVAISHILPLALGELVSRAKRADGGQ